jgi:hypothetical protein
MKAVEVKDAPAVAHDRPRFSRARRLDPRAARPELVGVSLPERAVPMASEVDEVKPALSPLGRGVDRRTVGCASDTRFCRSYSYPVI